MQLHQKVDRLEVLLERLTDEVDPEGKAKLVQPT